MVVCNSASSICNLGRSTFVVAIVFCGVFCLPGTTALSMKGVIGQAMKMRTSESLQHVHNQQQQQQHQRHPRAAEKTMCDQPHDLEEMFRKLNSQLNASQFLRPALNGEALSIPAGEALQPPFHIASISERRCPKSLKHYDSSAPLSERQLCPHYYDIVRLPQGYFPAHLRWAKCKCPRCVENNVFQCLPVTTFVSLLKPAGCFLGMQKYEEHVIHGVPVSCACSV